MTSGARGFSDRLDRALEAAGVTLLVLAAAVAVVQVFCRYVLNDSLSWAEEAALWAFVWAMFLGLARGVGRGTHIAIDFLSDRLPVGWRVAHGWSVRVLNATALFVLLVHGLDFVQRSTYVTPGLGLPLKYFYLAVPLGAMLGLVQLLFAPPPVTAWSKRQAPAEQDRRAGAWRAVLAVCAGGVLFLALRHVIAPWLIDGGAAYWLMAVTLLLMLMQVPVVFALVFGAFVAFAPQGELLLLTVPQNMASALNSFTLLAIPFFVLAAALMNEAGITARLIGLATSLVGHLRGGLGHVNVATNTLLAGVSGSSMADAAAIAKALVPQMERRGYDRAFSCAVTSASATLANLIPPSLGLIIYGALASVSVGALFMATLVPGLLTAAMLALVVHVLALRRGFGRDLARASAGERWQALRAALPALLLPVLIVGGVRFGAFTATEAGAVAALYALACGVWMYRGLSWQGVLGCLRSAFDDTVAVAVIIAAAAPFAWVLTAEQVPQAVAKALADFSSSPWLLLLLINIFLLVVGLFMEMIAAMVILVPILVPIVKAAGVDPVQFGIVLVFNLVLGALTPPMGMLAFTTARVGGVSPAAVFRALVPFMAGMLIVLGLITYWPALSLAAVRTFGP